jgi:hypothetical protein
MNFYRRDYSSPLTREEIEDLLKPSDGYSAALENGYIEWTLCLDDGSVAAGSVDVETARMFGDLLV